MGLALSTNLKFYTSAVKGLKIKVRKFWGLNLTFVKLTGEKLVVPAILNRVNICDVKKISFGSLSFYNDEKAFKLHVSLNISHSDRCLNIGSVSRVPCLFIQEMRHLSVFLMHFPPQPGHVIL